MTTRPSAATQRTAAANEISDDEVQPRRRRLRVLHLITSLDRGGAENHLLALAGHVDRTRFDVEVAVLTGEGDLIPEFEALGIAVHRLGARRRLDLTGAERLVSLLRERDYDIVHSHLFRADLYAYVASFQLGSRRPKLVATRHNDDRFFLHPLVGVLHFLVSARLDMIIAISDHIARFTIARGVWDSRRVRRVYHGLEVPSDALVERRRSELRLQLGLAADDFLIGNVGRLDPQKGQRHLVRAIPLLLDRLPNAHLVIVGGGNLERSLRELAEELDISDRVHVLGARRDVPAVMQAIDLFAMPSIWEGFGIVLLEAMAAAKPIVASRVATIPEVVLDNETGVLVAPGDPVALADAIAALAADPPRAKRFGEAGRQRLEQSFSLEKMVGDTEVLYEELVPSPESGVAA